MKNVIQYTHCYQLCYCHVGLSRDKLCGEPKNRRMINKSTLTYRRDAGRSGFNESTTMTTESSRSVRDGAQLTAAAACTHSLAALDSEYS